MMAIGVCGEVQKVVLITGSVHKREDKGVVVVVVMLKQRKSRCLEWSGVSLMLRARGCAS